MTRKQITSKDKLLIGTLAYIGFLSTADLLSRAFLISFLKFGPVH